MEDFYQCLLFATDLTEFILKYEGFDWKCPKRHIYRNMVNRYQFGVHIGHGVAEVVRNHNEMFLDCFSDLSFYNLDQEKLIRKVIFDAFADFFPEGYSPAHFLSFCAMTTGLALVYFHYKLYSIIPFIIESIASVLMSFVLTGEFKTSGGMNELNNASRKLAKVLKARNLQS